MKVNGIIAEYNPFHNGHKFHLENSKAACETDYTIVVMSGNFVQRGAPSLLSKQSRAEMALKNGADLVLELPVLYSTASAEYFASGGVALLDKLGIVDHLSFGSECGDIGLLQNIASVLADESPEYSATLKRFMRQGFSYPNARNWALAQHYPNLTEHQGILSSPNNILGIEYCKALLARNSRIIPHTIRRIGCNYNDRQIGQEYCSALAIRQALQNGQNVDNVRSHLPGASIELLTAAGKHHELIISEDFSSILYYKLLLEKETGYDAYLDISTDLSERIRNRLPEFKSFDSFCDLLKTKEITHTRISRCLLHILLNIKKEDMDLGKALDYVPYARVLGFRKDAAELLSAIKESSSIPMLTKIADARTILEDEAYKFFRQEISRNEIYLGTVAGKAGRIPENEFSTPIVIV